MRSLCVNITRSYIDVYCFDQWFDYSDNPENRIFYFPCPATNFPSGSVICYCFEHETRLTETKTRLTDTQFRSKLGNILPQISYPFI